MPQYQHLFLRRKRCLPCERQKLQAGKGGIKRGQCHRFSIRNYRLEKLIICCNKCKCTPSCLHSKVLCTPKAETRVNLTNRWSVYMGVMVWIQRPNQKDGRFETIWKFGVSSTFYLAATDLECLEFIRVSKGINWPPSQAEDILLQALWCIKGSIQGQYQARPLIYKWTLPAGISSFGCGMVAEVTLHIDFFRTCRTLEKSFLGCILASFDGCWKPQATVISLHIKRCRRNIKSACVATKREGKTKE